MTQSIMNIGSSLVPATNQMEEPTSRFSHELTVAERHFSSYCELEYSLEGKRTRKLYEMLSKLHALYLAGLESPDEFRTFLKRRSVKPHLGAGNDCYLLVKAMVPGTDRDDLRQSITEYGQALAGMAIRNVEPGEAVKWLSEMEVVGGRPLSGTRKAIAIFKAAKSAGAPARSSIKKINKSTRRDAVQHSSMIAEIVPEGPQFAIIEVTASGEVRIIKLLGAATDAEAAALITTRLAA